MVQPLSYLKETASQTAGPYVHIGLLPRQAGFEIFANNLGEVMVGPNTKGERVTIEGRLIDGAGVPVKDALIEIWQANAADPVLNIIEPASRRNTLLGQRQMRDQDAVYTFDIYLQGERETVFFDI